ncbi:anhydro-N-acetylmuramic acid kinase [Oceanobacter sp. 3_MG-2023]|uniref:anhydro-N-acetylmuramic acid kinase n=1 Tax=Oceanobacter sp. 3_MG-2023 TaxID=3062622 RepID=UPI002735629D|nr:anhydro-N-acetylmuramic acid kinase [Oceanobacter sp. 3_MG-2023]MDP2504735.1 anhydro-N-acetylmuramic acid kinase [Oceanobacter sp. 3_MG-2023]
MMPSTPERIFIGLMSGTSADSMDAVLTRSDHNGFSTLGFASLPYPADKQQWLRHSALADQLPVNEIMHLDRFIATASVAVIQQLLKQYDVAAADVCAIGSHGHTLRHQSQPDGFTWQIGDPSWIAEHSGICCVADFRRRDVAAGGHGAPLVPAFHQLVFEQPDQQRMVLNIGGIANLTILKGAHTLGFDTGPGNALMDEYCQRYLNLPCDHNGEIAASGQADQALVDDWLAAAFFTAPPPKSTGREQFSLPRLEIPLRTMKAADALATLTEWTARSIALAVQQFGHAQGELLICGGGLHNHSLIDRLAAHLPNHQLRSTATAGIHPGWIEAAAFAWLAKQTLDSLPGNLPGVTGARGPRILGAIYPA